VEACLSLLRFPTHGGVPLLWWTLSSVHVAEEHRPALYPVRTILTRQSGADSLTSFLRRSSRQSPALTGAQVFALFSRGLEPSSFQHLVTAPDRPPRAQAVTGNGCPIARVDRPVPSECHWHSSTHPTRARKGTGMKRFPMFHPSPRFYRIFP
jgi:hypothetical protein